MSIPADQDLWDLMPHTPIDYWFKMGWYRDGDTMLCAACEGRASGHLVSARWTWGVLSSVRHAVGCTTHLRLLAVLVEAGFEL